MRTILSVLLNLWRLLWWVLLTPMRMLALPRGDYVAFELTGDFPWRSRPRPPWRRRHHALRPASMEALQRKLELLATDGRVKGVVVKVEQFEGSGAKLQALRSGFEALRAAGKEVVFYGLGVDNREYALMASGSRIHAAPGGRIDLRGFAAELTVFGALLARVGIRAHFFRRGTYKTAPEMFTDSEVSEAQKETAQQLLGERLGRVVGFIAAGRNLPEETVRALVDDGPYTSARALRSGLIDSVGDGEELEKLLAPPLPAGKKAKKKAGQDAEEEPPGAKLVPLNAYVGSHAFRLPRFRPVVRAPVVAVVPIDGLIKPGDTVHTPLGPRAAGADSVVSALRRAREDRRVKAIVLTVDSRGGSALASELIFRAVQRADRKKPVVAFVESVAASGGYMAAVGARHFMSAPGALVGSIGVFGGKFEISGLLSTLGVGRALVRQGRHAAIYSTMNPFSEEEREALDRDIGETYQDFLSIVAGGRGMTVEQVHALGEGRVFSGARAHALGLVDALGDFEDAIRKAGELAGLRKRPDVVIYEDVRRALNPLAIMLAGADARGPDGLRRLERDLVQLANERVFAFADGLPSGSGIG